MKETEMWLARDEDMTLGLAIGEKPIKQKLCGQFQDI